jgi:hypothetical protein
MMATVFCINLLWFGCRSELRARGRTVSFWNHWRVFPEMHRAIREETDPAQSVKYKALLYSLYGAICLLVLGVLFE